MKNEKIIKICKIALFVIGFVAALVIGIAVIKNS